MVYQQASVDGQLVLSHSGRAYKLLELLGLRSQELLVVLGPWNGELPNSEDDYRRFIEHIRRYQQRVEQQHRGKAYLSWYDEYDDGAWWYEDDNWWDDESSWQWADWDESYQQDEAPEGESATQAEIENEAGGYPAEEYWDEVAYLWKPWKGKGYQYGKGKGKSKGKGISNKPSGKTYYGKGKPGGKKSSKMNPKGRDGQVLRCSICGSASHLRAQCPKQNAATPTSATPAATTPQTFSTWTLLGERTDTESTSAYLSMEPRLGRREALLVDTGAVNNLVGTDWISRAKNAAINSTGKGALLHGVGGAGTNIAGRAEVPLRLHSADGTAEDIKFNTTIGEQNDIPALLGLVSLRRLGAVIDCGRNMLYVPKSTAKPVIQGNVKEYILEVAPTGHYMLPVSSIDE
eukprot:1714998-Amphidinium_carterae.1